MANTNHNMDSAILIIGSAWLACQYPGFTIPAFFLVLFGLDKWCVPDNNYSKAKTNYYLAKTKLLEKQTK